MLPGVNCGGGCDWKMGGRRDQFWGRDSTVDKLDFGYRITRICMCV